MTKERPPNVDDGTATQDDGDEQQATAKSAEDRKAASALASLDAAEQDELNSKDIDSEAVSKAMQSLSGSKSSAPAKTNATKNVKVDDKDVALLVAELDINKLKATELLKAHDGNAVDAMRAWVRA